jgi:hypothetical protein
MIDSAIVIMITASMERPDRGWNSGVRYPIISDHISSTKKNFCLTPMRHRRAAGASQAVAAISVGSVFAL